MKGIRRGSRNGRLLSGGLVALVLVVFSACHRAEAPIPKPSSQTPVILISVDTLRSDHLPMYGYKGGSTPNLDAFRKDAILYEEAYSHIPLTLPSHTTMMTGLLPADNGVRDNVGFRLASNIPTLAELLGKNGYATGAAVSAFVLRKDTGISRGFDFYDDHVEAIGKSMVIGRVQREGMETERVAVDWLNQHDKKPFFFFLHLYDPHTPYEPPEPFKTRFAKEPYDGEIAYADEVLGKFFDDLRAQGVYQKALIIFLSDHGEGLWQHGEEEHGIFLYREAIQVPLLVKLPNEVRGGETVTSPVGLIDVFPTILGQTGTPEPKHDGRSLLLPLEGEGEPQRRIYSETFYAKFHFGWSDLHSLIDGVHHYIQAPRPELYDLTKDFEEKNNVLDEERRTYFDFKKAIGPFIKQAQAPANINPEEAKKLAALGYLGSTVQTKPGEALPDPKDTIDVFRQIKVAFTDYRDKHYDEALELINELLDQNGRMLDLWDLKSKVLQRLGREDEAIEAAKQGLRVSPSASQLALTIADIALKQGKLDEAQAHAELALSIEPSRAHETLARIYVARKDFAKANKEINASLAENPDDITALMTLARIEREHGDLQKALSTLDKAVALLAKKNHREVTNLHFLRGDILARMGNSDEAEKEFRKEIDLFPDNPAPYKNLVLLLTAENRLREASQVIRDLIEASPTPPAYIAVCEVLNVIGDQNGKHYWAIQGLKKFPGQPKLKTFLVQ